MSISTRHTLVPFVAGTSTPMSEQRLSRVLYKGKNEFGFTSKCVSVPFISQESLHEHMRELAPFLLTFLQETQDKIVKSLFESSKGKLTEVSDEDISIASIIGYLSAEETGGHLTKMKIEEWFTSNVMHTAMFLIAEKLNLPDLLSAEEEEKINKIVSVYKDLFSSLSGGKTILTADQLNSLEKILNSCEFRDDDIIFSKITTRISTLKSGLEKMKDSFLL